MGGNLYLEKSHRSRGAGRRASAGSWGWGTTTRQGGVRGVVTGAAVGALRDDGRGERKAGPAPCSPDAPSAPPRVPEARRADSPPRYGWRAGRVGGAQ